MKIVECKSSLHFLLRNCLSYNIIKVQELNIVKTAIALSMLFHCSDSKILLKFYLCNHWSLQIKTKMFQNLNIYHIRRIYTDYRHESVPIFLFKTKSFWTYLQELDELQIKANSSSLEICDFFFVQKIQMNMSGLAFT